MNRGFVYTLLKKSSELGYKREIHDVLNKFFTTAGFRDMIEYQINNIAEDLTVEELQKLSEAFKNTSGEKEIKLYLDVQIMERQFLQQEVWEDYGELAEALQNYATTSLEWQKQHDSWLIEKDDEKPMGRPAILGQGLREFFEFADKDVATSLKTLKNLFGIRPAMTTALSELSRLYGERAKVITARKQNPEKFTEMYNLEEALLKQIADLDSTGHTDEAVAIYRQLVDVLQGTFGVDTLHI